MLVIKMRLKPPELMETGSRAISDDAVPGGFVDSVSRPAGNSYR